MDTRVSMLGAVLCVFGCVLAMAAWRAVEIEQTVLQTAQDLQRGDMFIVYTFGTTVLGAILCGLTCMINYATYAHVATADGSGKANPEAGAQGLSDEIQGIAENDAFNGNQALDQARTRAGACKHTKTTTRGTNGHVYRRTCRTCLLCGDVLEKKKR